MVVSLSRVKMNVTISFDQATSLLEISNLLFVFFLLDLIKI